MRLSQKKKQKKRLQILALQNTQTVTPHRFRAARSSVLPLQRRSARARTSFSINKIFGEAEITDSGTAKISDGVTDAEIEFKNVSFGYGKETILHDISFTAKKGQMVALVGESGSGKSTIASLLARFWDVGSGEIRIRNTNIQNVQLSDLMAHLSMVFQRVYLFNDTIYNNIAMGSGATREEVMEAARKARCEDLILSQPYGLDTIIGEGARRCRAARHSAFRLQDAF